MKNEVWLDETLTLNGSNTAARTYI